jgi:hypothetical protein
LAQFFLFCHGLRGGLLPPSTLERFPELSSAKMALTSGRYVFSGHVLIREEADPQAVFQSAHEMLKKRFGFFFLTLQVETVCLDEASAEAIDITNIRAMDNHDYG